MTGKILKGIAGFYYVSTNDVDLYECKARGNFRNKKIKPLVGDNVEFDIIDEEKFLGNIIDVLPRNSCLLRPEVANVDQALIIFAVKDPKPNINLLSRFLIRMDMESVESVVCFNKEELATTKEKQELFNIFSNSGSKVMFTSTYNDVGLRELKEIITGKTTVLAGPSGVGKSSIMNKLFPDALMATGGISEKIKRGKHTTRHSELFCAAKDTYLMDTPGFTTLYLNEFEKDEIKYYFNEFKEYEGKCRFNGCAHINEPDCAVKAAVDSGKINKMRYDNYIDIYNELKSIRRY